MHRLTLTIFGHCAIAGQAAETDFGDIGNAHDIAVSGLQNYGFDVVDRSNRSFGADQ